MSVKYLTLQDDQGVTVESKVEEDLEDGEVSDTEDNELTKLNYEYEEKKDVRTNIRKILDMMGTDFLTKVISIL